MAEKKDELANFRDLIKAKRRKNGLTQDDVAKRVGITRQHYSRLERGEYTPGLQTFLCIAKVLNINLNGLSSEKEKQDKSLMSEIVELIESYDEGRKRAVLSFLKTMEG